MRELLCSTCEHSTHPPSGARTAGELLCKLSRQQECKVVLLKVDNRNGFRQDSYTVCQYQRDSKL
jgi:hypothetical protein